MRLPVRFWVLIWLCALTAIAYLQRNLGVAESTLRDQVHLSKDQMGLVQSCFFWSYALFQVPTGWLCQRWGPRCGLAIFCLTWSLATGLTGLADQLWMLCAIRFLAGLGQAAALPCVAEVVSTWFPQSLRGRASAWVTAFMQVGALLNAFATGPILDHSSLAAYFWVLAIPGLLWSAGFYLWYRDHPHEFKILSQEEAAQLPIAPQQITTDGDFRWIGLLTSPILWLISAQQFCRAAGYIFFGTWFPTFMQETRNFDVNASGYATGCTFAGVLIGSLIGGVISDWILCRTGSVRWARQGVAIASLVICTICIASSFLVSGDERLVGILSVGLMTLGAFFSGVAGPAGYAVTIDISGKHVATVFGCMNMAGNLGAALFAQIIPKLLGPSRDHWDLVIIVFAALYLAAAFFWSLLNPNHTVFGDNTQKSFHD